MFISLWIDIVKEMGTESLQVAGDYTAEAFCWFALKYLRTVLREIPRIWLILRSGFP